VRLADRSRSDPRGPAPRGGTADSRAGSPSPVGRLRGTVGSTTPGSGAVVITADVPVVSHGPPWMTVSIEEQGKRAEIGQIRPNKVADQGSGSEGRSANSVWRLGASAAREREQSSGGLEDAGSSWVCPRPAARQGTEMRPRYAREVKVFEAFSRWRSGFSCPIRRFSTTSFPYSR